MLVVTVVRIEVLFDGVVICWCFDVHYFSEVPSVTSE